MCARQARRAPRRSRACCRALKKDGAVPYVIPTGGSNEIGALGYAAAALELQQQAKQAGLAIDRVLFSTASGGTQAGLVVGMALAEAGTQVLGIDVENEADCAARRGAPDRGGLRGERRREAGVAR